MPEATFRRLRVSNRAMSVFRAIFFNLLLLMLMQMFPAVGQTSLKTGETLETRQIDLIGCIDAAERFVITTEADYLNAIRNDASRADCLKNVEKIDFDKHSLLGTNLNSGYCRRPAGLEFRTFKDKSARKYILEISYIDPGSSICRALSSYDLWVLVPKLPAGYEVIRRVRPVRKTAKVRPVELPDQPITPNN